MRRHIIPQEFSQQDRIGKFTIPQVIILGMATFLFVVMMLFFDLVISLIAMVPITIVAVILMFFRVNKMPLYEFLMIYLLYSGTPKLLIYRSNNMKTIDDEEEELIFLEHERNKSKEQLPKKKSTKSVKKKKTTSVIQKNKVKNQKRKPQVQHVNGRKAVKRPTQKRPIHAKEKGGRRQ